MHDADARVGQHLRQAVGLGVVQAERAGAGRHRVIERHIGARRCKGAQADLLKRIARIEDRVDDRQQQDGHEDDKADQKFRRMKYLAYRIFHALPPPLNRTARP